MNNRNKHIMQTNRTMRSFLKISIALACIIMFMSTNKLFAQVISNNGAGISITNGTFVNTDSVQNTAGTLTNDGTFNLSGTYINAGTTNGNGRFNIGGDWTNTNIFTPGNSTVRFNGNNFQTISSTGGETFYHLIINNSGIGLTNRIILSNDVTVSDTLNFTLGNVVTGGNKLYLTNQTFGSLKYNSITGSRVIGKFERGVNATNNYLFPVGSDANYNPMNLDFTTINNAGSILSEFIASDPDSIGLPLADPGYVNPADTVEVYNADSVGYWSVSANNLFESNNFDVNLSGIGFSTVQNASRIIKRLDGDDWILEGNHKDGVDSIAYRNTLIGGIDNSTGHHFGWGHIRPRIQTQPADTAVCDGFSATFSVVATGRGTLAYEWEVLELSGGWQEITDDAIYANSNTDTLLLMTTDMSMSGYKYRVIITDSLGNVKRSNSQATLTVNPNPVAIATPQQDTICNGGTTFIDLNSTVPGTTFFVDTIYTGGITGADGTLTNDTTIQQTLTNTTLYADSVVYVITPTGPGSTSCIGLNDTVVIWVEPTVIITAANDTICDNTPTAIAVTSDNITTNGMRYTWTVTPNANISGAADSDPIGQLMGTSIVQILDNTSPVAQMVRYAITPWTIDANGNNKCTGTLINVDIWIEPTVVIAAANDTICDNTPTALAVTSTNTTTNGMQFTWTVTPNTNISGAADSDPIGQVMGTSIIQTLDNLSDSKQLVQYIITPWTVNANDVNECYDVNEIITIDIWIDPTPRIITTILHNTICNDTRTHITLNTPTVLTNGFVTFDYTSSADPGLTGDFGNSDRTDGFIIEDLLHNISTAPMPTPLVVRYIITPRALSIGCADGLTKTDSITVHPTAYTNMIADSVVCYLESNGRAIVEAENGINEFAYNWDDQNSQTDLLATGLPISWYTVTVTDNQSCTKIDSVLIEQPDRLIPVIDTVRNVSCFGIGDAYIILNPTGGNSGYIYSWSNGESTDSIGGLNGGFIYVTVSDWKACTQDTVMEVDEPPQIAMDVSAHHITCNGENDGWAEVQVVGLDLIEWSTGETTPIINNLIPGIYTVTASNIEGCQSIGSTEIREPEILEIDSINSTRISCARDDDGTLDLFAVGGNNIYFNTNEPREYTYNWTTPDGSGLVTNEGNQTGLSGGNYYITVIDDLGCAANDSAIVQGPLTFDSYTVPTDVTCFEDDDGSIDLIVSGGNNESDYTYYWETSSGEGLDTISEDQTNLSGGDYFVTITDANNCEILDSAIIIEPDQLETFITETNISCFGYEDGTAKINIDGGNGENVIVWSGNPIGQNTDSIYGLSSGLYTVTVNDIENCVTSNSVEITEPEQIEPNIFSSNITCFGFSNGVISLNPAGGTIPYNYLWSHNASLDTNIAPDLWPGNYNIDILDANNCIESASVDITQPDRLEFDPTTYSEDITCYGEDDGYIFLNIGGGTPDYSYTWSTGASGTTIDITSEDMLTDGIYRIDISDLQNCQIDTTIEINEPNKLIMTPVLRKPTCADISDGSIELNITGGRTQNNEYNIYWDNGSFEENLYDIRSGIYKVQIIDSSNCAIDTTFRLQSAFAFCINIPNAFSPNGDNINEKWEIDMSLYPNAEIEIFDRFGKRIFFSKGYEESQYWDGSLNGKKLPMDAYYYIIYLKNGSGRISGTVTILR
ncbi:MAG: T9SS type B sorting domain-containing protein [Bacteroidales bacterium]|nr:T9SS type B sorting domain-containing protein [Bacteroidales bacterium]